MTTNIGDFRALGFKVEEFYNYESVDNNGYPSAYQKKSQFVNSLTSLSNTKSLHGLYIVSHGQSDNNGDNGLFYIIHNDGGSYANNNNGWGPAWSMKYVNSSCSETNDLTSDESWSVAGCLNYHLGAVVLSECYSFSGAVALSVNPLDQSAGHNVAGAPGQMSGTYQQWCVYWDSELVEDGFLHGGLQCTMRFLQDEY